MKLCDQHDLKLGKWGPYNKQYPGACHISNEELGASFALELFPAFYRRKIVSASNLMDGDVRMWGANSKLTHYVYRYELEWKDKVYCDVHVNITDDTLVNVDCEFVNNANTPESVNMFLAAGMEYPTKGFSALSMGYKEVSVSNINDGCRLIDAVEYTDIDCSQPMAQDGKLLTEREEDFATGFATLVSGSYFSSPSHFVSYDFVDRVNSDSVGIRYISEEDLMIAVVIDGNRFELSLPACDGFGYEVLKIGKTDIKSIVLKPVGKFPDIDALVVGIGAELAKFYPRKRNFKPIERTVTGNSMTLRYSDSEYTYKIEWQDEPLMIRTLYTDDVGVMLHRTIHDHVNLERREGRNTEGVYEIVSTNPLYLEPHTKKVMSFTVTSLKNGENAPLQRRDNKIYTAQTNSDGKRYAFSHNMMAYNTLLNVVYPIYTRRGYIRHSCPGKIWNCLYTWDSGFIGMGLATIDFERAYENLVAYLTPVGDKHSPYIFHGSVVPTQMFLYNELVSRFPDKRERLVEIYPMVMQYYNFFSRLSEGPEQTKSGILKTWHIFYNSGGWDDYPAQKHVRYSTAGTAEKHNAMITPVITTSLAVLIAKIMKNISAVLGIHKNDALFDNDIKRYSDAIEKNLWDDEAGYYSYLVHDENGNPTGFLRYKDGTNYNMGLDGAYPYIAGVSDKYRSKRVLQNVKVGMMTKYGLGVVDTRAPYYTPHGYWNGSVWIPHQWIFAKSLLDRAEVSFAVKILKTALSVWSAEVDRTYLCFEHFMSTNGRGAGFHHFSGLSAPVLTFFETLYKSGTVTPGLQTAIKSAVWNEDKSALNMHTVSNCAGSIIICMSDKYEYKFTLNGEKIKARRLTDGAYSISLRKAGENAVEVREI